MSRIYAIRCEEMEQISRFLNKSINFTNKNIQKIRMKKEN